LLQLRNVFFGLSLAFASLAGVPLRIEQVNELMRAMNNPKITRRATRRKAKVIPIDGWLRDAPISAAEVPAFGRPAALCQISEPGIPT
jgi:hypothetical protein